MARIGDIVRTVAGAFAESRDLVRSPTNLTHDVFCWPNQFQQRGRATPQLEGRSQRRSKVGLTQPLIGTTELPATYRFCRPCTRQSASTTPLAGSTYIRVVPHTWPAPRSCVGIAMENSAVVLFRLLGTWIRLNKRHRLCFERRETHCANQERDNNPADTVKFREVFIYDLTHHITRSVHHLCSDGVG